MKPCDSTCQEANEKQQDALFDIQSCAAPWNELLINYIQFVSPCCYFQGPCQAWDTDPDHDLWHFWNGPTFKKARRIVATGKTPKHDGCYQCPMVLWSSDGRDTDYNEEFLNISDKFGPVVRENWQHAITNYKNKTIEIDSYPLRYFILFGHDCNIKCRMCTQEDYRLLKQYHTRITAESLLRFAPYFSQAKTLDVMGGEPFFQKEPLKFIHYILDNEDKYEYQYLTVYTNGTLVHKHLDKIKSKKRMGMTVSLDGVGKTYEFIRDGGKWDRVESNMLSFRDVGTKLGYDWNLTTVNLMAKETLRNLLDIVHWHVKHDVQTAFYDFHFYPSNYFFYKEQGVLGNVDLLKEVSGWQDILREAIDLLHRHNNTGEHSLQKIYDDLIHGTSAKKYTERYSKFCRENVVFVEAMAKRVRQYLAGASSQNTRVAIFGSGEIGLTLADVINRSGGKFVCFVDNAERPDCQNVLPPSALEQLDVAALVISSKSHGAAMIEQVADVCARKNITIISQ